jgi:Flp pilus assembly protein TadD
LARREKNYTQAQADIDTAAKLAPKDPAIALEAGNIAIMLGRDDTARAQWQLAITLDPQSQSATSAKAYLAQLDAVAKP